MKFLCFLILLILLLPSFVQAKEGDQLPPLYAPPYMIIYGTKKCPATVRFINIMQSWGIPFVYKNINNAAIQKEYIYRTSLSGITRLAVPTVDINGRIFVSPPPEKAYSRYMAAVPPKE